MNDRREPRIEILAIYTPTRPPERLEQFVSDYLAKFGGDFPAARRAEIEVELRAHLAEAVLFEVVISNRDSAFDVGAFTQPDPALPSDRWQAAWAEVYLTPAGDELACPRRSNPPEQQDFRMVFWLHFFNCRQPLQTCYGELPCVASQPMPERLWRSAPYELPD